MKRIFCVVLLAGLTAGAQAQSGKTVELYEAGDKGPGKSIGTVTLSDSAYGLVLTPKLNGLAAGLHGFHIHQNASCEPQMQDGKTVPAGAAGGHFDPRNTKKHGTPWDEDAHAGDLPPLFVAQDGSAVQPVLAPRLKLADVGGRALMVHVGGDNHSDHPKPLGGGRGRAACGVIAK
ncbi:MAG: superoxide dismutase family protein [Burkholderiaceae bacterium]|nr:superoxide dismutase family protein [Burkholderiaceae bacterium]